MPLRIGLSCNLFYEDPSRDVYKGRPLVYVERSMTRFVSSQGALTYLIPPPSEGGPSAEDYARDLDGLVVTGGTDVAPQAYGEEPLRPEWGGDPERDAYELALVRAFFDAGRPIFGICRGHQVLNVAFGGSLLQDIVTQVPGAFVHRRPDIYEKNAHAIDIVAGSKLAAAMGVEGRARVNSVHHQAVKDVAPGFDVDARSVEDGVVEAISLRSEAWVRGVQWHPEFVEPGDRSYTDNAPLLASFLEAAARRRG